MDYIIHYDIAAIFMCIAVNVLYFSKKRFSTRADRFFRLMCILVFISTISDTISVFTIASAKEFPIWLNFIINGIFFLSFNALQLAYFRYMVVVTGYDKGKGSKLISLISYCAMGYIAIAILLTPVSKAVFYFENGVYMQGKMLPSLYIVAYIMLISSIALVLCSRNKLTPYQRYSCFAVITISSTFVILQFALPQLLITNFAASLLLLVIYNSLQNPEDYLEKALLVFNQKAFLEKSQIMFDKKKNFFVLAFDLDGFRFVDQTMGVEKGDELLQIAALTSQSLVKEDIYFLGATQFACFYDKKEEVEEAAERLRMHFIEPVSLGKQKIPLTVNLCCVPCPEFANEGDYLLTAIDLSLEECKALNFGGIFYTKQDILEKRQRKTKIINILKRAIAKDEFEVYYQPIYSVKDNAFSVAEALIRLNDPELGFIPPDEFIPLAENNGLIIEIGEIVFRKVCEFIAAQQLTQYGIRYIEVNLSMVQCMQENLHKRLIEIMDFHRIPYEMIDFEITETSMNTDGAILHQNMEKLISRGCSFAADDFGTGLSNADYLIEFPFEVVKLDRTFVWAAGENEKAKKILFHTASMIGSLDLKIVAEGIENYEQMKALLDVGCEYLQGYYFSKPICADEYIRFLEGASALLHEKMNPQVAK